MKLFWGAISIVAITVFAPFAWSQSPTLYYVGGPTGSLNNPNDFSTTLVFVNGITTSTGSQAPSSSDVVLIDGDINSNGGLFFTTTGTGTITVSASTITLAGLDFSNFLGTATTINFPVSGTVTITGRPNAGGTGTVQYGDFDVDGNATVNQNGGTVLVNQGLSVIGDDLINGNFTNDPGPGTYNVNSGTLSFDPITGAAGTVNETDIGASESGTLTASSSKIILGNLTYIGYGGGTGVLNITNGSTLINGSPANPVIGVGVNTSVGGNDFFTTGSGSGSSGVINVVNGTVSISSGADVQLGTTSVLTPQTVGGGSGTINISGASQFTLNGDSTLELGARPGGSGTVNLKGGTFTLGGTSQVLIGASASFSNADIVIGASRGTFNQTGGSLVVNSGATFIVGDGGFGAYTLSGGTATFNSALAVGAASFGSVVQSGGSLVANAPVTIGTTGGASGSFTLSGGTALFNSTFTVSDVGSLGLNGGTFQIAPGNFHENGILNFGGGTLAFQGGNGAFAFTFDGSLTGGTSTIDVSNTGFSSLTLANPLVGAGGIVFVGNGGTVFNLAATGNSFSGALGISNGTVNVNSADIISTSSLLLESGGTVNLAVGSFANPNLDYGGTLTGNGVLKLNFQGPNGTFVLSNGGSTGANIVLAADSGPSATLTPGTLQVFNGSFGTVSEVGAGNDVIVGASYGTGSVTFGNATYTGTTTINQNYSLTSANLASDVINSGVLTVPGEIGSSLANFVTNSGIITTGGIAGSVTNSTTGTITSGRVVGNLVNDGRFTTTAGLNNQSVGGSVTNFGQLETTALLPSPNTALPPASHATFTIGGDFTQMAPGNLTVRVQGKNAEFFEVGGTTILDGSLTLARGSGTNLGLNSYVILNSNGGVTGDPTTISTSALFNFAPANPVVIAGDTVTITTFQQAIAAFVAPFNPSFNQLSVARTIDATEFNPIKSFFNSVAPGPEAAPIMLSALNNLSPQTLQYSHDIAFENSNFLAVRMNNIDADLRGGYAGLDTSALSVVPAAFDNDLGHSMEPLFASDFHDTAPNGVNYYPGGQLPGGSETIEESGPAAAPNSAASARWSSSNQVITDTPNPYMAHQHPDGPEAPRLGAFVGGDIVLSQINQDQGANNAPPDRANYTTGDIIGGVSFKITPHLAAGVLLDYAHTDAKTDDNGGKIQVNSYTPGVFATYFDHGFYANGLFAYGYNEYDNRRDITFLGETATSDPDGQQFTGDLDGGYDFHLDKSWVIGPTLGVTYTHLDVDPFTETGAPDADLNVSSQNVDSVRSRLGGHFVYSTLAQDILLQPNLSIVWQHEYLDNPSNFTSSFSDFTAPSFATRTLSPSRDSALISLGLTATLNNSFSLYLTYLADVGASDYWAQSVIGGVKARF